MFGRQAGAIGEGDELRSGIAAAQDVVEFDPVSGRAIGEEKIAPAVRRHCDIGGCQSGSHLQHALVAGVAGFVDLQMAVTRVVDEGVVTTVALDVILTAGRRALAVKIIYASVLNAIQVITS